MAPCWLDNHEKAGGHVLSRHVYQNITSQTGLTDRDLLSRLAANTKITGASRFNSIQDAESVISQALKSDRYQIRSWANTAIAGDRRVVDYNGPINIGRYAAKGSTTLAQVIDVTNVRVVLVSKGYGKYYILTAFPR
ncbi:RNase A-like domain-containing protein [Xenorhabdus sp. PB62.4]|uniref:RNase A-like domain-containing protein n=1 Tax=Xenorhabdus sp. PB62.4 TaxID=1851573 RepID=UPI0016574947